MMRRVKNFVTPNVLKNIYNTMILPHFTYGIAAWGSTFEKSLTKIKKLQKKAIRIISKAHAHDHTEPKQKALKVLKIEDLYKQNVNCLMFDCIKGKAPDNMKDLFKKRSDNEGCMTRATTNKSENVLVTKARGSAARRGFRVKGPECWNKLPADIQNIEIKEKFRTDLKNLYLESYKNRTDCSNKSCNDTRHCNHITK